jgi:hypothetical protein
VIYYETPSTSTGGTISIMPTLQRTRHPAVTTVPVNPAVPTSASVAPSAVAGRIATEVLQSAGLYGRRAGATMFLWLLATRDTPPQSDF